MFKARQCLRKEKAVYDESELLPNILPFPRLVLARGQGSWVWDNEGKRYLDFTAGLGVMALGHSHPEISAVLHAQADKLIHCSNLFTTEPQLELATRLKNVSFASRVWFSNSGAESNEAAIKFARLFGRERHSAKRTIIAFEQGFHGRTVGSLAITHEPNYRAPFEPLLGDVRFAKLNDLESVRAVMDDSVCAIFVEPVQGEGGVLPVKPEFLQGLRALCDKHQSLLILDEIQVGMGRSGTLFAYEQLGVVPDIVTLAKPLAGGMPLGAILINDKVASLLKPGYHGSTFAGGPLVCAVACKMVEIINRPEFLGRVQQAGQRLDAGLQDIVKRSSVFKGTRGMGLMRAILLTDSEKTPPLDFIKKARAEGVLLSRAGKAAIRFLPPLNCTDSEIDLSLDVLRSIS
jgi:acetylornithine/N-succinyldiaminopimelate aminotransferase